MARLARARNRVEAPGPLARLSVVGIDEPADAELAAGYTHDDLVLYDERRNRRRVARFVVLQRHIPDDRTGFHVEGEQMRVERDHEQLVAQHAETAIDEPAARGQVGRQLAAAPPDRAPGARVELPSHVPRP